MIIDNNVSKVFKGKSEADRLVWVEKVLKEIIEGNWVIFDDDKNGAMDPQECFNFFQAQTKIPLDKCGFRLVYRENDFDGDNCYTQEEMYDLMQLLLQKDKPKTID